MLSLMKKSLFSLSLLFCLLLAQVFVSVHDAQHIHDERYKIVHTVEDDSDTDSDFSEDDCLVYSLTQTLSHSISQADILWVVNVVKEEFFFVMGSAMFVAHSFTPYQSRAPPFAYA